MHRNKMFIKKNYIVAIFILLCLLFLVYFTNTWVIRDQLSPSSNKDIELNATIQENALAINYKWTGYKETSTLADYIVVEYAPGSLEFISNGNIMGSSIKQINQVLPYLGGDELKFSQDKARVVIPLERKLRSENIEFELDFQKLNKPIFEVYYIHVVSLPMDNPSGWIKKFTNES